MNEAQIADIVRAVMRELEHAAVPSSPAETPVPGELPDLGSDEARTWIGVTDPKSADVLTELRRSTRARAPNRCCAFWPTMRARKKPCSAKSRPNGCNVSGCWRCRPKSPRKAST